MKKKSLFLPRDQALEAIRIDFRQYPPQIMLFSGLIDFISDGRIITQRKAGEADIWISRDGKRRMQRMSGTAMIEFLCATIITADMGLEKLAEVCSRVFQTHAVVEKDIHSGTDGIRIETGMEHYSCRQCGRCCRNLDYRRQLTKADITKWRALGREDILSQVDIQMHKGRENSYLIWIEPESGKYAEKCPFLKKVPTQNRWICDIHEVKPDICRNYPVTRKHAIMTGCTGFEKQSARQGHNTRKS